MLIIFYNFEMKQFVSAFILLTIVSLMQCQNFPTKIPSWLKLCQFISPNYANCLKRDTQMVIKKLENGIPGILPLDPFRIERLDVEETDSKFVVGNMQFRNIVVKGFGNTIVKSSKISKKNYSWTASYIVPTMIFRARYKANGKILFIPLRGNGVIKFKTNNLLIKFKGNMKLVRKHDLTYFNVTGVKINYKLHNLKFKMTNLFNGNELLGSMVNRIINANWKLFAQAVQPTITKVLEDIHLRFLRIIYNYIPAEFIIPDLVNFV